MSAFIRSLLIPALLTALSLPVSARTVVARQDVAAAAQKSLTSASAAQAEAFLQQLAPAGLIVSQLKTRLQRGVQVFDIQAVKNEDSAPWMVHINLSTADFRDKQKQYEKDAYELTIEQGLLSGRQRRWLGVWVQRKPATNRLQLPEGPLPVSGELGASLEPLNTLMQELLEKEQIPGATLAVLDHGQLVFERGFGWADPDKGRSMTPDAAMRIASVSKPLTAAAVLSLAREGRLSLDDTLFSWLERHPTGWDLEAAVAVDARWSEIRLRHLLQHTGGFDREQSRDTMFEIIRITAALGVRRRLQIEDVIRYQLTQPLDFAPGERVSYSNVGYCLLGRVLEAVTKQSYAECMGELVLKPCGMSATRLGKTQLADQFPDEVRYLTRSRERIPLVFDSALGETRKDPELVEKPYGQWDLELMDAHGGWLSTSGDLLRFMKVAMTPAEQKTVAGLSPELLPDPDSRDAWYGAGWQVRRSSVGSGMNFWHTGRLSGTSALLVRRWDNRAWAVLFNTDTGLSGKACADLIDPQLHRAVSQALDAGLP
ncbi:MAG: serine hydrolase domain-containing protein [Planctomycetota bacterium]